MHDIFKISFQTCLEISYLQKLLVLIKTKKIEVHIINNLSKLKG